MLLMFLRQKRNINILNLYRHFYRDTAKEKFLLLAFSFVLMKNVFTKTLLGKSFYMYAKTHVRSFS